MHHTTSTKRKSLFALLGVAVLANIAWFCLSAQSVEADFRLETVAISMAILDADSEKERVFEVSDSGWSFNGSDGKELAPFVIEFRNDHRHLNLILTSLSDEASTQTYKRVLEVLVDQGICHVGVVEDSSKFEGGTIYEVSLHQIVNITNAQGRLLSCVDRFIPASTSSD